MAAQDTARKEEQRLLEQARNFIGKFCHMHHMKLELGAPEKGRDLYRITASNGDFVTQLHADTTKALTFRGMRPHLRLQRFYLDAPSEHMRIDMSSPKSLKRLCAYLGDKVDAYNRQLASEGKVDATATASPAKPADNNAPTGPASLYPGKAGM